MKRLEFVIIAVLTALILTGCPESGQYLEPEPYIEDYRGMVSVTGISDSSYTQTDGTNSFVHNISDFSIGKYEV